MVTNKGELIIEIFLNLKRLFPKQEITYKEFTDTCKFFIGNNHIITVNYSYCIDNMNAMFNMCDLQITKGQNTYVIECYNIKKAASYIKVTLSNKLDFAIPFLQEITKKINTLIWFKNNFSILFSECTNSTKIKELKNIINSNNVKEIVNLKIWKDKDTIN